MSATFRGSPLGYLLAVVFLGATLSASAVSAAETEEATVDPDANTGPHVQTALGLRYQPAGLRLDVVGGYRLDLFDSESILFKDAYVEAGAWTDISPSNFWVGPYVELLPIAVLKLWASAQSLSYYGTFGFLYEPPNPDDPDSWDLDTLDELEIDEGTPAHGWMVDVRATPQAKVGNLVVQAETQFAWVDMDVDSKYFESSFDFVLEPTDTFWVTRPTVGWVFVMEHQWILAAFRWEHGESGHTDITRDMAALLGLWKLPWSIWGSEARLAVVSGLWVNHPNREDDPFYLAGQFSLDWGP